MKTSVGCTAVGLLLMLGAAYAAGEASVVFEYPEQFIDLAASPGEGRRTDPALMDAMKTQFEAAIARHLAPGQGMAIAISNVDLAGRMEPVGLVDGQWQSSPMQVRRFRPDAPPRIKLQYSLVENDEVVAYGQATLSDPDYLAGAEDPDAADPLLFEQRLFERWLVQLTGAGNTAEMP